MADKIKTIIEHVVVDAPTFHSVPFDPTLLNFFYGKNGSGKSTIARFLMPGSSGVTWQSGISPADYDIKVYNEDYIADNIQSYGNIPGVFTITEQNAKVKKDIDDANAEKRKISTLISKVSDEQEAAKQASEQADKKYTNAVWKLTSDCRTAFPETQIGFKADKKKFIKRLESTSLEQYEDVTLADISHLYESVYKGQATRYDLFKGIDNLTIPSSDLMEAPIVGSTSTPFAEFLRALNATDWVQQGHKMYHQKANGKCPYCQQDMPDDFEENLASCFDDRYRRSIQDLQTFQSNYKNALNAIFSILSANQKIGFACDEMAEYKTLLDLFVERGKTNQQIISQKINEPASVLPLQSLEDILSDISRLIRKINTKIKKNNQVFSDLDGQKQICEDMVWSYMARLCQAAKAVHESEVKAANKTISSLIKKGQQYLESSGLLDKKIADLNSQTVNTDIAMQSINELLRASGYQGFELQKKPHTDYVYQLVREDASGRKSVVSGKGLSEGERNFIAFLYFYHEIMGSQSDDGVRRNKIVVIDDPVSSMDSSALFVIASLTRNMIDICYNNFALSDQPDRLDHIRQFFCLTHNPYFFREITYNHLKDWECASFFEIKKHPGNRSDVILCKATSHVTGGGEINRSPVKNTYDALWEEYLTAEDPVILMNVIRQILEYYFLQICGYKNGNLRDDLLDKHKSAFDDGTTEQFEYSIASAMLNLVNTGVAGFSDGLYFDASAVSVDQLRIVFRKFFEVTKQLTHFEMMTRK